MSILVVSTLLAAWSNVPPQLPVAKNELTVQALEAVAQITPRAAGQRQISAPKVSFSLRTQFACRGNAVPLSLSIGIADTSYRHVPVAGERSLLAIVEVPAGQVAPINIGNFCVAEHQGVGHDLLLPGVATAHVSLRCDVGAPPILQVTSVPLPLRLTCVSAENQDDSAAVDSPAR